VVYFKVSRNSDPRFDIWFEAVAPRIDAIANGFARDFMRAATENRNHQATLSLDTVRDLITWGDSRPVRGWVQQGTRAILTERMP